MNQLISILCLTSVPFVPTYEAHIEVNTVLNEVTEEIQFIQIIFRDNDNFAHDWRMINGAAAIKYTVVGNHISWVEESEIYIVKILSVRYSRTTFDIEATERTVQFEDGFPKKRVSIKDFYNEKNN